LEIFETPSETQGCYKALEKGRLLTEDRVRELGEGWKFPVPPPEELAHMASLEGVDEDHLKLLYSRATPQPLRTYTQPLRLENPAREGLPKLGILCSFSLAQVQEMIASDNPSFRKMASPNWRFVELPTGHYPMFSRPDDLAAVLLDLPLASGTSAQDDGERGHGQSAKP
jgi:hypothetical protein